MVSTEQKQKYQAYAAATQTVARTKQIVMLYDGAIRFLQQAKEAISEQRIEDRYKMLTKASDIIMGLQSCLDFDSGGNVGRVLYNFYSTIDSRIFAIHRSSDVEACEQVIADLKRMRDVWHEIDQNPPAEIAPVTQPKVSNGDENITISA